MRERIIQLMSVSSNLKREMKIKGAMSQYRLAELSGVPQPTIQRILKGSDPKSETIKKIAAALEISSSKLLDDVVGSFINDDIDTFVDNAKSRVLSAENKGLYTTKYTAQDDEVRERFHNLQNKDELLSFLSYLEAKEH